MLRHVDVAHRQQPAFAQKARLGWLECHDRASSCVAALKFCDQYEFKELIWAWLFMRLAFFGRGCLWPRPLSAGPSAFGLGLSRFGLGALAGNSVAGRVCQ